jgi:hypothetical protein
LSIFLFIIIERVLDCFFSAFHNLINVSHCWLFLIVLKPNNSYKRTYHFKDINHMVLKGWHQNDFNCSFPINFPCPFTHLPLFWCKHVYKIIFLLVYSLQRKLVANRVTPCFTNFFLYINSFIIFNASWWS